MLAKAGAVEMHMHVDRPRRGNQPLAVAHGGGRGHHQVRIDAIHDRGVPGLAEPNDLAVLDPEVAFDDAEHRIDHEHVAQQEVERPFLAGDAGGEPDAVPQRLAAAVQAFVTVGRMIVLDHRDQRRVAETDAIACGRAVEGGVVPARNSCHSASPQDPRNPAARARCSAASRPVASLRHWSGS